MKILLNKLNDDIDLNIKNKIKMFEVLTIPKYKDLNSEDLESVISRINSNREIISEAELLQIKNNQSNFSVELMFKYHMVFSGCNYSVLGYKGLEVLLSLKNVDFDIIFNKIFSYMDVKHPSPELRSMLIKAVNEHPECNSIQYTYNRLQYTDMNSEILENIKLVNFNVIDLDYSKLDVDNIEDAKMWDLYINPKYQVPASFLEKYQHKFEQLKYKKELEYKGFKLPR